MISATILENVVILMGVTPGVQRGSSSLTLDSLCMLWLPLALLHYSSKTVYRYKNLGRLWLAYTELQGGFYMLQLISVDSRHFTPSYTKSRSQNRTPFCTAAQNNEMVLIPIYLKDVGLLWYHQMLERIMGNCQLKLPYILRSIIFSSHQVIRLQ